MLKKFFGLGTGSDKTPPVDAQETRGLEVVEDDPDTAWSMWDSALADQDSRFLEEPKTETAAAPNSQARPAAKNVDVDLEVPTQPLGLQEKSLEQRKNDALEVVELHHRRIANTIRTLWGYKECSAYINKLIIEGGDGMGHARVGFNQAAVEAMLALADVHDAMFGDFGQGIEPGLGTFNTRTGFDGSRF
jgi:hypothetical protein